MIPQFKDEQRRYFHSENFAAGLFMFALGLFKKAVIADTLAVFADNGFGMTNLSFSAGWVTSLSYTLQIYFDFSGYSDMAIGLGRMFNIDLPINFFSPYCSESVSVFWRRWHITLGRALRTYIYFPLGGSRKGSFRTCFNLFLTFFVSGLWHGAAWTFVLWGCLHGTAVVLERIFQKQLNRVSRGIRVSGTFFLVNAIFVLFRSESIAQAGEVYRGMLNYGNLGLDQLDAVTGLIGGINFPGVVDYAYLFVLLALLLLIIFKMPNSIERLQHFVPSGKALLATALLFSVSLLCLSRESVFIYFNF